MHTTLIQAISSVISIDEREITCIKQLFKEKTATKGDYFLQEGEVCRQVGFLVKGLVRYFINNDGEEMIYDFGKEGNFMCNYESFLDHSASNKNIQFIEDSYFLTISYDHLQVFYEQIREGQKFGRIVCEQIFVDAIRKITSLYTHPPEKRYLHFMETYPDLQQCIPQYYTSSFVGVKPQSLSRIRKRMISS
ncbi:Crp/Fnr family transcriptional regulator [Cytophagaceae bacterium DM2B3-1]|uniref:Crp/Fnr family transcriptional regulator n=1 Tax=Xanthocytophaga flava TaxID=3048013 RepID=A0ABT7CWH6_9BACT|nr:Crp/Fnr family transcriptional regulator [Xanthocytophaga flavus]MDJ1498085.1 Crp/Fnr family transcriptional regulator [Xanthocytophaga flavus]